MSDLVIADTEIRQLHARYTDAVWRHDYDAFADCFTSDAQWRISGRVFGGRTEIRDAIERILGNFRRVLISFGTPIIAVCDGGATGRTYITEQCAWKDGNTNVSIGRYYEHFVDEGDRWRFAWRLFQLHYRGPPDLSGTFVDNPDYGPPPGMPDLGANTNDHASERWKLSPGAAREHSG